MSKSFSLHNLNSLLFNRRLLRMVDKYVSQREFLLATLINSVAIYILRYLLRMKNNQRL